MKKLREDGWGGARGRKYGRVGGGVETVSTVGTQVEVILIFLRNCLIFLMRNTRATDTMTAATDAVMFW